MKRWEKWEGKGILRRSSLLFFLTAWCCCKIWWEIRKHCWLISDNWALLNLDLLKLFLVQIYFEKFQKPIETWTSKHSINEKRIENKKLYKKVSGIWYLDFSKVFCTVFLGSVFACRCFIKKKVFHRDFIETPIWTSQESENVHFDGHKLQRRKTKSVQAKF